MVSGGWDANTDADWGKLGSGATGLRTSLLDNFASIIRDYCQIKVSLRFKLLVKFAGNISAWEDAAIKLRGFHLYLLPPANSSPSNGLEMFDFNIHLGFKCFHFLTSVSLTFLKLSKSRMAMFLCVWHANTQIHKYKYTNTQIQLCPKLQICLGYGTFLKK